LLYLDHNSTTPLDPAVRAEMDEHLDRAVGNPSSPHSPGQEAKRILDQARARVAGLIGARPHEILFTSGGTEADNLAVFGGLAAIPARRHLISVASEHQAVRNPLAHLAEHGYEVSWAKIDRRGRLDPASVVALLREDTALVSVMLANNETGVIQPVAEFAEAAHAKGALLHSDAVQALGKIPVDVTALGVDLLSLSSHKIHGPQGVGALYVRAGTRITPLLFGGHQERGLRPGTENVVGIAGFGKACELAAARLAEDADRIARRRDQLEATILQRLPDVVVHGAGAPRLPNTSYLGFPGINGEALALLLDLLGVAVATGSACSSAEHGPSHVLQAMGLSYQEAASAIRFSLGREHTSADIARAVEQVARAVGELRGT